MSWTPRPTTSWTQRPTTSWTQTHNELDIKAHNWSNVQTLFRPPQCTFEKKPQYKQLRTYQTLVCASVRLCLSVMFSFRIVTRKCIHLMYFIETWTQLWVHPIYVSISTYSQKQRFYWMFYDHFSARSLLAKLGCQKQRLKCNADNAARCKAIKSLGRITYRMMEREDTAEFSSSFLY